MALTDADKEWVKLITEKLVGEVTAKLIESHITACPHGKRLANYKWFIIGLLAANAGGVGIGALVVKMFGAG